MIAVILGLLALDLVVGTVRPYHRDHASQLLSGGWLDRHLCAGKSA
ncbi:hypothetical protein U2F26_34160 [Micromonospora sp. 4G57]|uniref:Prepilin peptidase n=1 Tax=Micromonospora sicca TaxID=2202420 RepID=A0ABU5JJ95_9ACTN|nr:MULTISPECIES: hypothetical protein [unclassified Micromonospora]MDZ5447694.1 hypothetical protein [Micromonospora sp. 4G57]MDZ5492626.1 hypothetical protein [Micromonospora sp. 4G53]